MSPISFGLGGLFPWDNGIAQTATKIGELVRSSIRQSPRIRQRAVAILRAGRCAERDERCMVGAIFAWTKKHFVYTKDPPDLELLQAPDLVDLDIEQHGDFRGDCDDVTAYLAALCWSIGIPSHVVTISLEGKGPEFRHIYPEAWISREKIWLPLEATARNVPLGWSADADSTAMRRRVFEI